MLWYVRPRLRRLPSPRRQARRDLVEKPVVGALAFGAILGIGWLTVVVTPLVWVGLAASIASGSVIWGGLYGVGFGLGRSLQLFSHYFLGPDSSKVVARTLSAQARFSQVLGLTGGGAILVAVAIGSTWW